MKIHSLEITSNWIMNLVRINLFGKWTRNQLEKKRWKTKKSWNKSFLGSLVIFIENESNFPHCLLTIFDKNWDWTLKSHDNSIDEYSIRIRSFLHWQYFIEKNFILEFFQNISEKNYILLIINIHIVRTFISDSSNQNPH